MERLLENAKVYVGGLPGEVTEDALKEHFVKYGRVVKATAAKDDLTGKPKNFGFVWFAYEDCAKAAVRDVEDHVILGTKVEVREAIRRERSPSRRGNQGDPCPNCDSNRNGKKIFVGGLPSDLTKEEFKGLFEVYGETTDVVVMVERGNRKPRGFGFVTYKSEESARNVLRNSRYLIHGKDVEVKLAIPKEEEAKTTNYPNGHPQGYHYPLNGVNGHYYDPNTWPRYGEIGGQPYAYSAPSYPCTHSLPPPLFGQHYVNGMIAPSPAHAYGTVAPWPAYANGTINGFHGYNGFATTVSNGYSVPPWHDRTCLNLLALSKNFSRIRITKPPVANGEAGSSSCAEGPSPVSINCNIDKPVANGEVGSSSCAESPSPVSINCNIDRDGPPPSGLNDGRDNASPSENGQHGGS